MPEMRQKLSGLVSSLQALFMPAQAWGGGRRRGGRQRKEASLCLFFLFP